MKKKNVVIKIIFVLILVALIFCTKIYATPTIDTNIDIGKTTAIDSSEDITENFAGILQVVGSVVSLVALVIIGFRYMLSSVDERAELKGVIGYYIVGAILVFATSNVLSVAYKVISGIK